MDFLKVISKRLKIKNKGKLSDVSHRPYFQDFNQNFEKIVMVRLMKTQANLCSTRNFVLLMFIVVLILVTCLFFDKLNNELYFTNASTGLKATLYRTFGSIRLQEYARTETKTDEQSEVTNRFNPKAKDLLLKAINKASLTKQQSEKHLHKDWFLNPSSLPYNLLGRPDSTKYFSQEKQDEYVDRYFNEATNKVFLEVGAVDGIKLSNTLFLERQRNWTGLLIEPNKDFYKRLTMVHRKAYCVNTCLSLDNNIGTAKFRLAAMIGGFEEGYTETMKRRASSEFSNAPSVEVFCIPIGLILTALEMFHIHFFSLDVEGAELTVLKTIPFDKVKIDLFFIEYLVWNVSTDVKASQKRLTELREFFKKIDGYREIRTGNLDVVFARM